MCSLELRYIMEIIHYILFFGFCILIMENIACCMTFGDIIWGKRLSDQDISTTATGISLLECVKECQRLVTCCSINHNRNLLLCQMNRGNHKTRPLQMEDTYIYSDISTWGTDLITIYANKSCPESSSCRQPNGICKISGCENPPLIKNGAVKPGSSYAGSVRTYGCNPGYVADFYNITCQPDGNWSSPVPVCREIANCLDIQSCSSGHVDGEYQMRPKSLGGTIVGLYCHGLNTTSPAEFLTLHKENVAAYNFSLFNSDCQWYNIKYGKRIFKKVKIDITDVSIVTNDATFADEFNVNGVEEKRMGMLEFGFGGECISNFKLPEKCARPFQFIVDLTSTGFTIDRSTKWTPRGHRAGIYNITRSSNNLKVQGKCGGRCGYCRPDQQKVWLKLDPESDTFKSAMVPTCSAK